MLRAVDTIGARIREVRGLAQLTQEQMGDLLGVSANTVKSWENGYNSPRATRVANIQRVLQAQLDRLQREAKRQREAELQRETEMQREAEMQRDAEMQRREAERQRDVELQREIEQQQRGIEDAASDAADEEPALQRSTAPRVDEASHPRLLAELADRDAASQDRIRDLETLVAQLQAQLDAARHHNPPTPLRRPRLVEQPRLVGRKRDDDTDTDDDAHTRNGARNGPKTDDETGGDR